ncbi:HAD-IA family hydrolase [Patescibacteria group bacterium]|nr:HAD-IA family hydrolase [Patescibacteria group bacterium]
MTTHIIFDFDGTIADTYQDTLAIANEIRKEQGSKININLDDVREYGLKQLIKKLGLPAWKIPKFIHQAQLRLKEKNNIKLFSAMPELFKELAPKYKLGIISSNNEEIIRKVLKKYGVENLFEFIYSDSSLFGKHLVLKRMRKKYRLDQKEIIYIGDEDRDIIAAKKDGIKIIAVTWGFNSEKRLRQENPDYLAASVKQLLGIISQI